MSKTRALMSWLTMQWIARNIIPALSVATLLGAALYSLSVETRDTALVHYAGTRAVVEGIVVADPDVRDNSIRLTVRPETVNTAPVEHSKNILISVDRFSPVAYGDRVRASGALRAPEAFETDAGRTFNYPKYLWARGVSYELPFAAVEILDHEAGNPVVARLISIKHALILGMKRALPEPYAALAEGLLLGEKQSLGDALYDAFRASGVVHIIVLSGYNVSLVIESVLFISLRFLPRLAGYGVAAVFMIGFTVLTGASETTLRAALMALLMMTARILNRPADALRGLMIAAAIMALWNPFLVLYDLSFQLSVLATLGLVLFSEHIAARIRFVSERLGLREIMATTIATQITVLPLLILSVGAVSLVFLPANALVLPAVPLAMLLSFIAALAALLSSTLGIVLGFPAYLVLAYIIAIPEFFGAFPFASIAIPPSATWAALGIVSLVYAILLFRFFKHYNATRKTVLRLPPRSNS